MTSKKPEKFSIKQLASAELSPNEKLENDPSLEYVTLNRRNMYYLDYLLKQNIHLFTGTYARVYKGLQVDCDNSTQECVYKVLDTEIEARGDCFFHSALYNLGKKYLGKRHSSGYVRDSHAGAVKFRQMLVDHYVEQTGDPTIKNATHKYQDEYEPVSDEMPAAYAHKYDRNVIVFYLTDGGFRVLFLVNKNHLDKNIDFFIFTPGPDHFTTLKRKRDFKQNGLMDLLLQYRLDSGETIMDDVLTQPFPEGSFKDIIRTYEFFEVENIYRLFDTLLPVVGPEGPEPRPIVEDLTGLTEHQRVMRILESGRRPNTTHVERFRKEYLRNMNSPRGASASGFRHASSSKSASSSDNRSASGLSSNSHLKLPPLLPPSAFLKSSGSDKPSRGHGWGGYVDIPENKGYVLNQYQADPARVRQAYTEARSLSPDTKAYLKQHVGYSPTTDMMQLKGMYSPPKPDPARVRQAYTDARSISPDTKANLKQYVGYSPTTDMIQLKGMYSPPKPDPARVRQAYTDARSISPDTKANLKQYVGYSPTTDMRQLKGMYSPKRASKRSPKRAPKRSSKQSPKNKPKMYTAKAPRGSTRYLENAPNASPTNLLMIKMRNENMYGNNDDLFRLIPPEVPIPSKVPPPLPPRPPKPPRVPPPLPPRPPKVDLPKSPRRIPGPPKPPRPIPVPPKVPPPLPPRPPKPPIGVPSPRHPVVIRPLDLTRSQDMRQNSPRPTGLLKGTRTSMFNLPNFGTRKKR